MEATIKTSLGDDRSGGRGLGNGRLPQAMGKGCDDMARDDVGGQRNDVGLVAKRPTRCSSNFIFQM